MLPIRYFSSRGGFSAGFGVIDIVVALTIFLTIASSGVTSVLHSFQVSGRADNTLSASAIAQEGIEAVRSLRNQAWDTLVNGTHGVSQQGGLWVFSGTSDVLGAFTREITVADVFRDGNGTIVLTGGTLDPDTKKITSLVTWQSTPVIQTTYSVVSYLTNWKKPVAGSIGDWTQPTQIAFVDLTGGKNNLEVQWQGNYAYVVRDSASLNFVPIDVSDSFNPFVLTEFNVPENPNDIVVSGNFSFLASKSNTQELQIVDISNPSAPFTSSSHNISGTADARGLSLIGSNLYMVRGISVEGEFIVFDVTVPNDPVLIGLINLGDTGNGVVVMGTYAYVASSSDTQEVQIIDISTPSTPLRVGSYDLAGTGNALSIVGVGSTVILGRDTGEVFLFDVSTPLSPIPVGLYSAGDSINDISLGNNGIYLFLATNNSDGEFQVVDISDTASPVLFGVLNLSDILNGVSYDTVRDVVYAVSDSNSQDFLILAPQ